MGALVDALNTAMEEVGSASRRAANLTRHVRKSARGDPAVAERRLCSCQGSPPFCSSYSIASVVRAPGWSPERRGIISG